ncbi:MAG: hypothetical protein MUD14_17230 [Hydrococcus sp. Prado102]|nr:hypothetical protein [Hydrococcus sp. Prado102]
MAKQLTIELQVRSFHRDSVFILVLFEERALPQSVAQKTNFVRLHLCFSHLQQDLPIPLFQPKLLVNSNILLESKRDRINKK